MSICLPFTNRSLAVAASLIAASTASVVGAVLVDLDASAYSNGNPWSNSGTLGGTFNPTGTPTPQTVAGVPAVVFDGAGDYFNGPPSVAPIDGTNPTRSIEAWVYQGNIRPEETLVSWARRGGPDGSNMSFNYGASTGPGGFGAIGHWGAGPDIGWNGAAPASGQWHHLVYTFSSVPSGAGTQGTTNIYVDGALQTSEIFTTAAPMTTHPGFSINLGAQRGNAAGFPIDGGNQLSGAIGRVRVHDVELTPGQISAQYAAEVAGFTGGAAPQALPALPTNRYTFNNLPSGVSGTVVPDVIGGQDGTLLGDGATVTAGGVDLPGLSSLTQAYVDLPNGIISSKPSLSAEAWVTVQSTQNWSRIFDFGTNTAGEVAGPGGSFTGSDVVILSASTGTSANQRLERVGGAIANGTTFRDTNASAINGQEFHVVMTYDDTLNEWRWYRDGILMEVVPDTEGPTTLPDVNVWLGRSNWSGDSNTDALYNEFRLYDYTLTENQILGNFLAGPDTLNVIPEPTALCLVGLAAAGAMVRRRRR